MQVLVGGTSNLYSTALDTTAKTLTISNVTGFDLTDSSLSSIYDVTATVDIPCSRVTCALTRVAGKPVWTFTFLSLPAGVANGDTLSIYLNIPQPYAQYSLQQYANSKV